MDDSTRLELLKIAVEFIRANPGFYPSLEIAVAEELSRILACAVRSEAPAQGPLDNVTFT